MKFINFNEITLDILSITNDIPLNGAYLPIDVDVDINFIKLYINEYDLVDYYIAYKYDVNDNKVEDYTAYWMILKSKCMRLLDETNYLVDGILYVSDQNRIEWSEYRKALKDIVCMSDTSNPYVVVFPTKPQHVQANNDESLKLNARFEIDKNVGDLYDLVADLSKNVNVLERLLLRFYLHYTGIKQMDQEYIDKYTGFCSNYIELVDNGTFVDRADLEDDTEMISKLLGRRMQIGQIVKNEYFDKKSS